MIIFHSSNHFSRFSRFFFLFFIRPFFSSFVSFSIYICFPLVYPILFWFSISILFLHYFRRFFSEIFNDSKNSFAFQQSFFFFTSFIAYFILFSFYFRFFFFLFSFFYCSFFFIFSRLSKSSFILILLLNIYIFYILDALYLPLQSKTKLFYKLFILSFFQRGFHRFQREVSK